LSAPDPASGFDRTVDPTPLVRLSTAYWDSQVFLTANRLKLFDVLAPGAKSAQQVAAALNLQTHPARLFLNACVGLGLLQARDGRYSNSPVSQTFLISGNPAYIGNAVLYSDHLYDTWGRLEKGLRQPEPVLPSESYLGGDAERTRAFVYGMHDRARGLARSLVALVDLGGRCRMLDVGGGPGTYSMLLTERYPQLKSIVLELEGVVRVAREIVATNGAEERVQFQTGDYQTSEFPAGRDVVLMSGMFHRETEQTCRRLIDKSAGCLQARGMLIVSDVFTDRNGTSPTFATLFGLNMMLTARDGGVHADADVAVWMRNAGFGSIEVRQFPPPMPHRVLTGVLG
jgi:ubiquinone/menaquinone biosynthesis C-methylase UbiE